MSKKSTYKDLQQRISELERQTQRYKGLDLKLVFEGIENSSAMGITNPMGMLGQFFDIAGKKAEDSLRKSEALL